MASPVQVERRRCLGFGKIKLPELNPETPIVVTTNRAPEADAQKLSLGLRRVHHINFITSFVQTGCHER